MNKEQIVDKYMKEVMPMTTKFDYGILKQQLFNLLEYAENEQLILCGVVRSLPESKDRILELEKAIVSWDLKNDINDKQAFSCGWNNCYRWIKDFVRQQR